MDAKNSRSEDALMDNKEAVEQQGGGGGDTADTNIISSEAVAAAATENDSMAVDDDAGKKTAEDEGGREKSVTLGAAVPAAASQGKAPSSSCSSRHQATAASAAANDLLRLLGDASNSLSCIQGVDGCTFVVFNGGQLAQMLQASGGASNNNKIHVAPGHEKDAVCIEDICAAARTYATQVCALQCDAHMHNNST